MKILFLPEEKPSRNIDDRNDNLNNNHSNATTLSNWKWAYTIQCDRGLDREKMNNFRHRNNKERAKTVTWPSQIPLLCTGSSRFKCIHVYFYCQMILYQARKESQTRRRSAMNKKIIAINECDKSRRQL